MPTVVQHSDTAVWWRGGMRIDADGAPNAYGPAGKPGLDYLANAGKPGGWYGIVVDAQGNPVVQGPNDPCPGMYVSPTSLVNRAVANRADPKRYVDSTKVPYIAVPSDAVKLYGIHMGDLAYVYCAETASLVGAVVADVGPKGKYGEGSIALAQALGVNADAKKGGASDGILWIVFPGSGRGWPREMKDVYEQLADLLAEAGNLQRFL